MEVNDQTSQALTPVYVCC